MIFKLHQVYVNKFSMIRKVSEESVLPGMGLRLSQCVFSVEKYKKGDNKKLFIAIGCSLALLMIVVIAFVLYIKERNRNNTYKRFFMAHNNYTVCCIQLQNLRSIIQLV